ncbi:EVE domain-containing protein [Azospirillum sp. Sh1]|uniref:EVE domain-containing protein n=1 Tax=Azospirillum sp. Sh1 TaxID=2607285 RepID=UPI0011EEE706|nr:EVE domain-containing protein [Azospirillum sp. Sh1]KAA0575622.1 EVE domain-containing protein [Azospirillum sp. Sh1]
MSGGATRTGAPIAAWIAVASAEHVRRGRAGGFMQVCHGKAAPLRRIRPGDRVVYYSPTDRFGAADGLKSFTAIGTVLPGEPYQFDMGDGFIPFRRDVSWWPSEEAPIQLLLDRLELTAGVRNWGYPFRFGLLPVSQGDFDRIAEAMRAAVREELAA